MGTHNDERIAKAQLKNEITMQQQKDFDEFLKEFGMDEILSILNSFR